MFNSYSSEYANQVHQLTVSVSKHYWATKDGIVKYQHKPMDVQLAKVTESQKTHLVLYIVRDHFSGLFYSRVAPSHSMIKPLEFLKDAWSKKPDFVFCGQPTCVAITDTVEKAFPGTREAISQLGVSLPKVTSGFHGGIRDVRTVEERLKFAHDQPMKIAEKDCLNIGKHSEHEESRDSRQTKAELWRQNLRSEAPSV